MDGLDKALATIAKMKEAVSPKAMKSIDMEAAQLLLDEFRATAPVVTGRFRKSAFLAPGTPSDPNVLFLIDFSICPYAEIVEKGNKRNAPHNTIQRAIAATEDEMDQQIQQSVTEALQEALD